MNAQQFAQIVSEYPCIAQAALETVERAAGLQYPVDPFVYGELSGRASVLQIFLNNLANERKQQRVAA